VNKQYSCNKEKTTLDRNSVLKFFLNGSNKKQKTTVAPPVEVDGITLWKQQKNKKTTVAPPPVEVDGITLQQSTPVQTGLCPVVIRARVMALLALLLRTNCCAILTRVTPRVFTASIVVLFSTR